MPIKLVNFYSEVASFNILPIDVSHVLIGRPWISGVH